MKKYVKLETVGTVEREREREALYLTWKISAIVVALQISQKTNLIATVRQNKSSYIQLHANNKKENITRQVDL